MSYKISNCIPQLPVLDFEQAKLFYIDQLGCKLLSEYDDLLMLELEGNEFHLWKCNDKSIPESSSMYIRVTNIASLYEKETAMGSNGVLFKG
jgi:extradiol dioxygenase family protein